MYGQSRKKPSQVDISGWLLWLLNTRLVIKQA